MPFLTARVDGGMPSLQRCFRAFEPRLLLATGPQPPVMRKAQIFGRPLLWLASLRPDLGGTLHGEIR